MSKKKNNKIGIHENYKEINEFILKESKGKLHRNYIYFFKAPKAEIVSIVCEFGNDRYYGLNPSITTTKIRNFIFDEKSIFSSEDRLFDFIRNNDNMWNSDFNSEENRGLFAKTLLVMASMFYLTFKFDDEYLLDEFCDILNDVRVKIYKKVNKNTVEVYGRIPDILLNKLAKENYYFEYKDKEDKEDKEIHISKEKTDSNFTEIYKCIDRTMIKCKSQALYSGVNIRLNEVIPKEVNTGNQNLQSIKLKIERTTYATICCFDNNEYNKHLFLEDYEEILSNIDIEEVKIQEEKLEFLNNYDKINIEKSIECLNNYLRESKYPHYINVSGNITTSDNYCIYTRRGNNTMDANTYYCSSNGVSEVYDSNVDFYKESVDEDTPTIFYDKNQERINFNGELDRESEAELGISSFIGRWKYYGFSIMGHKTNKDDIHRISLHFNILAHNNTNFSFKDIVESSRIATERDENEDILGYKLNVYNSRYDYIKGRIKNLFEFGVNWKDVITLVILLIIFILDIVSNEKFSLDSTRFNTLDIALSVCLIAHTINILRNKIKDSKNMSNVNIILNKNTVERNIKKTSKKILKRRNYDNAHVILLLMNTLYLLKDINKDK
ncbi:Uncharacterised protein [uncultured Clostridium sp.]|nr:Uncharacterised protein [uncultured Clostridium sp.]SCJ28581.1 Uncharacterised protein [uncultured Clostridium sp.]